VCVAKRGEGWQRESGWQEARREAVGALMEGRCGSVPAEFSGRLNRMAGKERHASLPREASGPPNVAVFVEVL
jgi:hypothetical protein